ncbi:uncharacterized protein LOC107263007 isoform X1 [Cephus cinctus]|uniref:Uncharacterized protein LOC107263007 isoform X1 n=1 Tax=Cephus cinctus TaxID=211228 RepID=A0AAJ7VWW0_CEPCN|nr:uncharacterized protein LOC107263007 isoform X1 [Cephus cinctus]
MNSTSSRTSGLSVHSPNKAGSEQVIKQQNDVVEKETEENAKTEIKIVDDTLDIQPLLYSFKIPQYPSRGAVMSAMLPPYWLYQDHVFGVIWMLFHKEKKYIGIPQLHWCLRFLLDLKNAEGTYAGDVNICIQAIQDNLIEQYANLGTKQEPEREVNPKIQTQSDIPQEDTDMVSKKDYNEVPEDDGHNIVEANILEHDIEEKKTSQDKTNAFSTSTKKKTGKSCSKTCAMDDRNALKYTNTQKILSLTYNEMVSRGPSPCTEPFPLEQLFKMDAIDKPSNPEIAAKLTEDLEPPSIPFAEMDSDDLANFLNSSRQQHVERIKKEIERLYNLEKFMENISKRSFSAYVTDDLARRLDKLDGHDVVNGVESMIK